MFKLFQRSTKVSGFMLNQQHTGKERWQRGIGHSFQLMKEGKLKSGSSGKTVTNPKQAIAIGLSEARKEGKKVPEKRA